MSDYNFDSQHPVERRGGVSPIWLFFALTFGFMLPVCACAMLTASGFIGIGALANSIDPNADTGSGAGIGVVDLNGVIYQGEGLQAASQNFIKDLEWMEDNNDVKAIVIKANSPGGDANASDVMWHHLSLVSKPVYVAVDGLCASGCYYIAMGATPDEIYATPNSLVGSIGVISTFFNIDELMADVGVDVEIIATGENKDFGSPFRDMTEGERAYWLEQTTVIFETFISRVSGGRGNHLSDSEIRELADGRVWSASIAEDLGLIDGLMYTEEVMDRAADQAGLGKNYRVIESPFEPTFFDLLFAESPGLAAFDGEVNVNLPDAQELSNMLQQGSLQYRYYGPYSGSN